MTHRYGKCWLALALAFLLSLSSVAFGTDMAEEMPQAEDAFLQELAPELEALLEESGHEEQLNNETLPPPEEELGEDDIVEAIQEPLELPADEPEPIPALPDSELVQPVVLDVEMEPVATDEPLYTPLPGLENNPGFIMGMRSEVPEDLYLNPGSLRIPSDGMSIPLIYQYDYRKMVCSLYGVNKSVASSGCGAAAASMLIAYIRQNYNQTPYTLFYWAVDQGWYHGDGLHYEAIRKLLSNYGVGSHLAKVSSENIISALRGSQPIVIKMGPGTFTNNGHYIVLRGLDEDGWVLVNDPNSSGRSQYSYPVSLILRECKDRYMLVAHARAENAGSRQATVSATRDGEFEEPYSAIVKRNSVNLRRAPVSGEVVLSVEKGTVLNVTDEVVAEGQAWCAVEYQGHALYIRGDMIKVLS